MRESALGQEDGGATVKGCVRCGVMQRNTLQEQCSVQTVLINHTQVAHAASAASISEHPTTTTKHTLCIPFRGVSNAVQLSLPLTPAACLCCLVLGKCCAYPRYPATVRLGAWVKRTFSLKPALERIRENRKEQRNPEHLSQQVERMR